MGTIQYSFDQVVTICAGFAVICGAAVWIIKIIQNLKHPSEMRNNRLSEIEGQLARHDECLARDKGRIDRIDEGNRVTQRAILALLSHGIDGNEVASMKRAKDDLEQYLINR